MKEAAKNAVLILGPTASGKSALAVSIARERGATIVNADSMQVYSILRVLTARPDEAALEAAPHALYGHVHPTISYSTGAWLRDVGEFLDRHDPRRPLVFVGGTGLYFRALTGGLSAMPEVPEGVRRRWRYRLAEEGSERLHRLLRAEDPEAALSIRPGDGQRIIRALEVKEATGQTLTRWQGAAGEALIDAASADKIVVLPPRDIVHARIEARFDRMIDEGAVEEVRELSGLRLDPALPAMKAIGVEEIAAALDGRISFVEAITRAKARTRQYAKRQETWLRHQLGDGWRTISPSR